MKRKDVLLAKSKNWNALYIDNECVMQNFKLDTERFINAIGSIDIGTEQVMTFHPLETYDLRKFPDTKEELLATLEPKNVKQL